MWSTATSALPPVALIFCLYIMTSKGVLFDYYVNQDLTLNGSQSVEYCTSLGYDGLAVTSSPEALTYVKTLLQGTSGFIGLTFCSESGQACWEDGSIAASDLPWESLPLTTYTSKAYGRLTPNDELHLGQGDNFHRAVCGTHKNLPYEGQGSTVKGMEPTDLSSSTSVNEMFSYQECALLCSQDNTCRAAVFDTNLSTCRLLGEGDHSTTVPNSAVTTFLRLQY